MSSVEAEKPVVSTWLSRVVQAAPFHAWNTTEPPGVGRLVTRPATVAVSVAGWAGTVGLWSDSSVTVLCAGTTVRFPFTKVKA